MHNGTRYNEMMQKMADVYFGEHNQERLTTRDLAVWAIRTGQWEPPPDLIIQKCKEDFAKAMREQYIEDEHGRPVRAKHAARIRKGDEQLHFWADIRFAPRKHMEIAFGQRREQIVGDCRQLKRDVDYFNTSHPTELGIQTVFDFTDDIAEGEHMDRLQPA